MLHKNFYEFWLWDDFISTMFTLLYNSAYKSLRYYLGLKLNFIEVLPIFYHYEKNHPTIKIWRKKVLFCVAFNQTQCLKIKRSKCTCVLTAIWINIRNHNKYLLTLLIKAPLVAVILGRVVSLYMEMAPHNAILPNWFILLITVAASSPPTLSKKQSTPLGAPSFKASSTEVWNWFFL